MLAKESSIKVSKTVLAKRLDISRSTLYYHSKMDRKDQIVKEKIVEVLKSNPCYGHKRLALELNINKKRILRIMKKYGLEAKRRERKKLVKTEDISLTETGYNNEIKFFCPIAPNIVWCGDFTYIKFKDSFIYLATIIDVYTREIVGFAISRRHNQSLVKEAFLDATRKRGCHPKYFHSDQGSEYQSYGYISFLIGLGVKISMSRKSSPWENPWQESFYSQFKLELGDINHLESIGQVIEAICQQIYYYNNRRIHSVLKMSPKQFYQFATARVDGLNKGV